MALSRNTAGIIVLLLTCLASYPDDVAAVNGGTNCLVCSAVIGLFDQLAIVHETNITVEINNFCNFFGDGIIYELCREMADFLGPIIIDLMEFNKTSDIVCHTLGFCFQDPGEPFCHLFPLPEGEPDISSISTPELEEFRRKYGTRIEDPCSLPGIKTLCEIFQRAPNPEDLPLFDADDDRFSTYPTFRGTDWRGQDCNDNVSSIYPGRMPKDNDADSDSNCNGIYGINEETGVTYEEELCGGIDHRGIMILGDSAGANFHIPQEWLTPTMMNAEVFSYLPYILSNTFNFPMTSGMTGYKNVTAPILQGYTDSVYLRMLERNRCIHRDYQNIAVNGGKATNILRITQALARNQTLDYPLLISLAVIGNDVCRGDKFSLEEMTTEEEMRAGIVETLDYLDQTIPAGSHVILSGLVDGRALYDNLHYRVHPIGEVRQDVTYSDFYEVMNCLQMSPCPGWMSNNQLHRDLTSERAANLSRVMEDIAQTYTYNNFDMIYMDFPAQEVIAEWEEEHGPGTGWMLIEIVDGFHPSQTGQAEFSKKIWQKLEANYPYLLGEINPNNDKIKELFGDQGGY